MKAVHAIGTIAEELGEWINSELELFERWGEQIEVILYAMLIALAIGCTLGALFK